MNAPAFIVDQFDRCRSMIQDAADRADGTFDTDFVWSEIEAGRAQLWPGPASVVVTRLETYPSGVSSVLCWLAGGDLDDLRVTEATIANWAKNKMNCTRIEIVGRRGWLRALEGYREQSVVLTKEL